MDGVDINRLQLQCLFRGISESEEGRDMRIYEVEDRSPELMDALLAVWESSVRATHLFLAESEIHSIKGYVPEALYGVEHLLVAVDDEGEAVAFMGVQDGSLEMLFIEADSRGKGLGRRLLEEGIDEYSIDRLTVNEQNPQARGFYEHMGFRVCRRTELDEQGNPYPLLYMRLGRCDDQA